MNCIYQKSKHYQKASLDPLQIVEPIGHRFLNPEHKPKVLHKKREGEPTVKHLHISSLTKRLSQNSLPFRELERVLKISESTQRKNVNLNGKNLEFVNRELGGETLKSLEEAFFPVRAGKQDWFEFLQLLGAISVLREVIFSIRDYALSTYLIYYQGENSLFYNYIQKTVNEELLEYDHQVLINSPQLARPQLRKIDYRDKTNVQNYINEVLQIGKEKDPLFGGIHLYLCDLVPTTPAQESPLREEAHLWPYLLYQITLIVSILNEGQHALLKIKGTFTQKTIEYIYLLRMAFNRVYLHKNFISNPFSNDKYIICEGFNKDNGEGISRFLLDNYDSILKEGEHILLVELKAIYANDFHTNVNDFNNLGPMIKTSKEVLKEFNENCNTAFYPSPETFLKRLEELKMGGDLQEMKATLAGLIPPSSEERKSKKEPVIEQKEAVVFDFDEMLGAKQNPKGQSSKKDLMDLSSKKEGLDDEAVNRYLSNGDKVLKKRKEKARKKKKEETE